MWKEAGETRFEHYCDICREVRDKTMKLSGYPFSRPRFEPGTPNTNEEIYVATRDGLGNVAT
jgi:hypothetical protein